MSEQKSGKVAVLVENLYQEMEVWVPVYRLREIGYEVQLVGPRVDTYKSKLGYPAPADVGVSQALTTPYDAVIIPGGYAPDLLRDNAEMVELVRSAAERGAIVAAICHGSWMLASAGLLRGRRVTGASQIRDDLRNAGGEVIDQPVVRDGNLITSRKPADIPDFCAAIVEALAEATADRPARTRAA